MAASDYTVRGTGIIAPVATLTEPIGPNAMRLVFNARSAFSSNTLVTGGTIMIGQEIMRINAFDDTGADVSRGCADTIPQTHSEGVAVWFIDNAVGTDSREYVVGESVATKVLMRAGSKTMTVESAPPNDVTFAGRFIRPYPPGQMLVDGAPWHTMQTLSNENTDFIFTWAHRDRVLQADTLQGHEVGSIGPEPGTTYVIRIYKNDGTLVRTVAAISGTTWTYTVADARLDLGVTTLQVGVNAYATLHAVRDGHESWQHYTVNFKVNGLGVAPNAWGAAWGGAWGA